MDDAILQIGVHHGLDDTGNRKVNYKLYSGDGKFITEGAFGSKNWEWLTHKVKANQSYRFIVEDNDTHLHGKHRGNGGSVQIILAKPE